MPAKHSARSFGLARIFLSAAAAVLVMLVVWIAVRAVGPAQATLQPKVVLPSMPQMPISPASSAIPTLSSPVSSPSASPSASSSSPSPARSSIRPTATSHSPKPEKTSAKPSAPASSPSSSPPPAPKANFSVTVSVGSSWEQGYVASVRVRNTGNAVGSWSVTVSHADLPNLRLVGAWNVRGSQNGDSFTFTGGPLAAGASASFGYQASKTGRGNARPSGCSVVGGKCGLS